MFVIRRITILFCALFLLLNVGYATAGVTMTVQGFPGHSGTALNMGAIDPNGWAQFPSPNTDGYYNVVNVVSDTGTNTPWHLYINDTSDLTDNTTFATIPNSAPGGKGFLWMSSYAGDKNPTYESYSAGLTYPAVFVPFSTVQTLVYTSGRCTPNDNNNLPYGTEIQFQYQILMPDNQQAGSYSTDVIYTVTQ